GQFVWQRVDTLYHQAGNAERVPRQVTGETVIASLKARLIRLLLLQIIEDRSLSRIERGNLEQVAAAYPSKRGRVVEIDRARIADVDERSLKARLREDERLRFGPEIERRQCGPQVSVIGFELQLERPVRE